METWEDEGGAAWGTPGRGDARPAPRPAPTRRNDGACRFCPYALICSIPPPLMKMARNEMP